MMQRTFPQLGGFSIALPSTWHEHTVKQQSGVAAFVFSDSPNRPFQAFLELIGPLPVGTDGAAELTELIRQEAAGSGIRKHDASTPSQFSGISGGGADSYTASSAWQQDGTVGLSMFLMLQNGRTKEYVRLRLALVSRGTEETLVPDILGSLAFV